jgi:hypothetical protein
MHLDAPNAPLGHNGRWKAAKARMLQRIVI